MAALLQPVKFDRERDLLRVLDLVALARASGSTTDFLHPGGLQWWLRRLGRERFAVKVCESGDELVAFVLEDDGYVIIQTDGRYRDEWRELLVWAEDEMRSSGGTSIEISVPDGHPDLTPFLISRGYAPAGTSSEELVYELGEPPQPVLPPGFAMASLETVDDDAFVQLHRDGWSTRGPSPYNRKQHDAVTSMPGFRRDLVPVVLAPNGTPAAYCIGWSDAVSGSLEIEPLATRPAYRRIGLATAIVREIVRRGSQHGAEYVMVWGVSENPVAKQLYKGAGFRKRRVVKEYRKALT